MEKTDINKKISSFINKLSVSDIKTKENILEKWMSDDNQKLVFNTEKTFKKSAYFWFCGDERERLRNLTPPVVKRDEVHKIMSKKWKQIKDENGSEYKKYIDLSNNTTNNDNVKYEVTKPFHKFSVEYRKKIEDENKNCTASEITDKLKQIWKSKTNSEKLKWKI